MRSICILLLVITLPILTGSGACADDKQEIRDLYSKLRNVILGNHPEGLTSLTENGFTAKDRDGKAADVNQLIRQMKLPEQDVTEARMYLMIYKFDIRPPTASVPYKYYYSAMVVDKAGKMGSKGKRHSLSTSGLIRCELTKTAAGWRLKSMELQNGITRIDRKNVGGARQAP